MTDRDRLGLRGSAKRCDFHSTYYSRGSGPDACETEKRGSVTVVEFRPDGSLQRHWVKNPPPNSSEWTSHYEYNGRNQLSAVRTEQDGTISTIKLCEYDSAERISRTIMTGKDGKQRVAETYSYEADGGKKKIVNIDPGLPFGCGFGLDGTDSAYSAPGATSITSIYDERGRPIEHLFHDGAGELVSRVDMSYDERGNLVEEVCTQQKLPPEIVPHLSPEQLEAAQMMFTFRRRHRYDEQNRRIETSMGMAPNDVHKETYTHNDHGEVILQTSESSHAEYTLGEEGLLHQKPESIRSHRWETQLRYQYDSNGNWIEKIVEAPGGPIWSIERRTITYFD
jgi:hypothetical protein